MAQCQCSKFEVNDYIVPVVRNKKLADRVFWMTFEAPELAAHAMAGLAVMVYPSETGDPLLGRPFALADAEPGYGEISVCFMVLGRGTEMLSRVKEGDRLRVRGFLGNPYPETGAKRLFLAGGGAGIAAMLMQKKEHPDISTIYIGMPGKGYKKFAEHILSMYPDSKIFADDGSFGDGDSMFKSLPKPPGEGEQIWCCGPPGFLEAMRAHCEVAPERLYYLLDKRMACGYGGCMGCVIETKDGPKRVCVDQSIFRSDEVNLNDN